MEIEQLSLTELFDSAGVALSSSNFEDERDVKRCYVILLRVLARAYERKYRIQRELVTLIPLTAKYEQDISRLVSKGFAYEERKRWMELQSESRVRQFADSLQEADYIIEACKRYESLLNGILACHKLGIKLSFEGHE